MKRYVKYDKIGMLESLIYQNIHIYRKYTMWWEKAGQNVLESGMFVDIIWQKIP